MLAAVQTFWGLSKFHSSSFPIRLGRDIIPQRINSVPAFLGFWSEGEDNNKQLIEQLPNEVQNNQDPKDIGDLNIANVMLWMKKKPMNDYH